MTGTKNAIGDLGIEALVRELLKESVKGARKRRKLRLETAVKIAAEACHPGHRAFDFRLSPVKTGIRVKFFHSAGPGLEGEPGKFHIHWLHLEPLLKN